MGNTFILSSFDYFVQISIFSPLLGCKDVVAPEDSNTINLTLNKPLVLSVPSLPVSWTSSIDSNY